MSDRSQPRCLNDDGEPRPWLSIVIPFYNEEDNVRPLHEQIVQALDSLGKPYEVIAVDDGSTDRTLAALDEILKDDQRWSVVVLRRNFGQTAALSAGFDRIRGDVIVTLDGDLQNDPADIPKLLELIETYDMVSGWRADRKDPFVSRRLPSMLANWLISVTTGIRLHDYGCTLKAYRRQILSEVNLYGEMHRFLPVLVAWVGGRITELEVTHHPRASGVSKYGLFRIYKVLVDVLTVKFMGDFSARPNYVFGGFGLISLVLGLVSLCVVAYRVLVLRRLEATPVVFLMVIFFLAGILSIFIGFLAEIVIRGFFETQRRPTYYVRETVGIDQAD